ncbi:MAG: polyhydroxybutyrate depolymerase [bacterium]
MQRRCLVHLPAGFSDSKPAPLVLVLHGGRATAHNAVRVTGMNAVADRHRFIAAYPEGTGDQLHRYSWNAGRCCGRPHREGTDDTGFIGELVNRLAAEFEIDRARVYACGMSNGGMMAHRLGIELSDVFAGIACVAGSIEFFDAEPLYPVSVAIFHGTADALVPYDGGPGPAAPREIDHLPVSQAVRYWVKRNGCNPAPLAEEYGPLVDSPGGAPVREVLKETYVGGKSGTEVVLWTVRGGLHAWPGGRRGSRDSDEPTQSLDASEEILRFFDSHPKRW